MYDPFAGTGSLLYTAMHWGAMGIGSDIDGRQMRGKGASPYSVIRLRTMLIDYTVDDTTDTSGPGVFRAAQQYALRDRLLDCATFDVTAHPWRRGGVLDAIVTDPPCECGNRARMRRPRELIGGGGQMACGLARKGSEDRSSRASRAMSRCSCPMASIFTSACQRPYGAARCIHTDATL